MEIMKKKNDTGKHDSRTACFRIACIVSKIWLRQVEEKKHDNSYDLQIDGPAQFLIFSILLTFHRIRQGPDNFEDFVKIQIFLQLALCSVKAIIIVAQPKAGTRHKMQTLSVAFCRFFNVKLSGIYRRLEIYRWLVTFGSARWVIEILSAILKSTRHEGQSRERL